jgi:hypothetical protein
MTENGHHSTMPRPWGRPAFVIIQLLAAEGVDDARRVAAHRLA